jgi:FtsP/CotA-like multicopper oxidase with cupredoxin domain
MPRRAARLSSPVATARVHRRPRRCYALRIAPVLVDIAKDQGLTLFHCHQQLHMDYGLKTLFNVT